MSPSLWTIMEPINDYILMRRPAIPRKWSPLARPHVAIIIDEPLVGQYARYYISQIASSSSKSIGSEKLETVDIDEIAKDFPVGTLLEVKFNATNANLYQLEKCGSMPCWRWVGKYRGINTFEHPSPIDWTAMVTGNRKIASKH